MGRACSDPCEATKSPRGSHTRLQCWVPHSLCAGEFTALGGVLSQLRLGPRPGAERHVQLGCSLSLLICQMGSSKASTSNILASKNSTPGV